MGMSDSILYGPGGLYTTIAPEGDVALLGFSNTNYFNGDCYDLQLGNWEINSNWELSKKYDTIISLRCPYFAKNPEDFIKRCYNHLNEGGKLYIDWGLGDHWRFDNFKVGWVKNGEQEYAYKDDNYLWSTLWDDRFADMRAVQEFEKEIKSYGYESIRDAVSKEVPSILRPQFIHNYFNFNCYTQRLKTTKHPQIYILVSGVKK